MTTDIVRIEVHRSLQEVLETLRHTVAKDMKAQFGLTEISVPRTLSSQILAAKLSGKKAIDIRVKKVGVSRGVLELL